MDQYEEIMFVKADNTNDIIRIRHRVYVLCKTVLVEKESWSRQVAAVESKVLRYKHDIEFNNNLPNGKERFARIVEKLMEEN